MTEIWVAAVGAAVTAYSAYSANKSKKDAQDNSNTQSELGFQRAAWLDQQQRMFQLQDLARNQQAANQFAQFAPEGAQTFMGKPLLQQQPVDPRAGLMNFDPEVKGSLYAATNPDAAAAEAANVPGKEHYGFLDPRGSKDPVTKFLGGLF